MNEEARWLEFMSDIMSESAKIDVQVESSMLELEDTA